MGGWGGICCFHTRTAHSRRVTSEIYRKIPKYDDTHYKTLLTGWNKVHTTYYILWREWESSMNRRKHLLLLTLIIPLTWGCTYLQMTVSKVKLNLSPFYDAKPSDMKQAQPEQCGVIMGKTIGNSPVKSPIIVIAVPYQFLVQHVVDYTVLSESGPYMLYVPEGKYQILAFIDVNENLVCEPDEYIGQYGNPDAVKIGAGEVVADQNFVLNRSATRPFDYPLALDVSVYEYDRVKSLEEGGIISLTDDMFGRKYGLLGLWTPSRFIESIGANVYALETYDHSKIPILFIHGSGGTPRDWDYVVNNIDRNRYQPWFFYYPSGLPLQTVTNLLYEIIRVIYERYKFENLYITAHSMGGLIARSFITTCAEKNEEPFYLKLFVSISTPWGGVSSAKLMPQKGFFEYPPSWTDLTPGSQFIEGLYKKKLPGFTKYYLLYGYKSKNYLLQGSDDGVVTVTSQLDPRAHSDAAESVGFKETHKSILSSKEVLTRYKELLSSVK